MKIAVLSDIHGNLPALQVVATHIDAWQPDQVIVNGDIVNRGPRSLCCLRFIQEKQRTDDWQMVRGNHEDFLIACSLPNSPKSGPEFDVWRFAHWAYQQLNGDVSFLESMPHQFSLRAPDNSELRVVHASMHSNRDGIYANTPDEKLMEQIAPVPAVFVTAHTHKPLIRQLNNSLVVNVGAVGAPFDQDSRASYGQFTWKDGDWQAKIIRLEYDREQTIRDYVESGFLEEAGPLAQLMLIELRRAHGLIYRWAHKYEKAVLAGEISIEESVRHLLLSDDVAPFLGPPGWVL